MAIQRFGGTFAPPLTTKKLDEYDAIAKTAPAHVSSVIKDLIKMARTFLETPTSTLPGRPHPAGRGMIVPLETAEVQRIDSVVPWDWELDAYQKLFDSLPTGVRGTQIVEEKLPDGRVVKKEKSIVADERAKALRDACFHLLWYAKELAQDREPITTDKL